MNPLLDTQLLVESNRVETDYDSFGEVEPEASCTMGRDMTPEEAEAEINTWQNVNTRVYEFMAYRRRSTYRLYGRKGWKALGYATPIDFAADRLSLGKAAFWGIIANAEIESGIVSKVLDFEKENVKDSVLTALKAYAPKDRIRIIKRLLENRKKARQKSETGYLKPIGGRDIGGIATQLNISPISSKPPCDIQYLFPNKDVSTDDGITYTLEMTRAESDILWQLRSQLSAECGNDMTPVEAIKMLIAQAAEAIIPASAKHTITSNSVFYAEEDSEPIPLDEAKYDDDWANSPRARLKD